MTQTSSDMPVFCDVGTEEQIDALKQFFKSRNPKLFDKSNNDVADNLNELVLNMETVYNADISETDLGMVLNSILSLIVISSADRISKLVTVFCEKIVSAQFPERCGIVKLRVLSNLFHGLVSTSKDRYMVYLSLIRCSLNLKSLQYLPHNFDTVRKYLESWNCKTEEVQVLYRSLFDALAAVNDSKGALKIMSELLGTYTKETASKSKEDAHKCIAYCINDPNTFIFDNLLLLEPIKHLEGQLIHNLLTVFVSGKLQQYTEFYAANKAFIAQLGLVHEKNVNKMRILTFMSLGENNKIISFDVLQQQLQISADEVESFVIDAIRTKCIRCKIDHLARTITVISVSYRTFSKQHWQLLRDKLDKWRDNLVSVDQNLSNLLSQGLVQVN